MLNFKNKFAYILLNLRIRYLNSKISLTDIPISIKRPFALSACSINLIDMEVKLCSLRGGTSNNRHHEFAGYLTSKGKFLSGGSLKVGMVVSKDVSVPLHLLFSYFFSLLVCRTCEIHIWPFLTSYCPFCSHILNLHHEWIKNLLSSFCGSCSISLTLYSFLLWGKLPELYKKLGQKMSLEASRLKLLHQPNFETRSDCSGPYPVRFENLFHGLLHPCVSALLLRWIVPLWPVENFYVASSDCSQLSFCWASMYLSLLSVVNSLFKVGKLSSEWMCR